MLEVLIARRFPEGRAHDQVLDPGAAQVEDEEGMQVVPSPGRAWAPIRMAEHGEEHGELAKQRNTGKGQWRFVSVECHVISHLLPGLRFVHLPGHSRAVVAGTQDNACRLEPRFVVRDSARDHPEIVSVAKIGAEGLLGAASQIVLFHRGQLEDSLSTPPNGNGAADRAGIGPGIGIGTPDSEMDDRQPPYGERDPDQSRIPYHTPNEGPERGGVRQTPGQVACGAELPGAIAQLSPLDWRLIGAAGTLPCQTGPSTLSPHACCSGVGHTGDRSLLAAVGHSCRHR